MLSKRLIISVGFILFVGLIFLGSASAVERCVLVELFTNCG